MTSEEHLQVAQAAFDEGDFRKVLSRAKDAEKADPSNARSYLYQVMALSELDRVKEAKKVAHLGLSRCPNQAYAHVALAVIYKSEGQYENALECYDKAIALDPAHLEHYFIQAQIANEAYLPERVDQIYQSILAIHPKDAGLYMDIARNYLDMGHRDRAFQHYAKAIELQPDNNDYRYWRGRAYFDIDDFDMAHLDFSDISAKEPHNGKYRFAAAKTAFERDDHETAFDHYQAAIAGGQTEWPLFWECGSVAEALGKYEEAIQMYSEAIQRADSDDSRPLASRGRLHYNLGSIQEAYADMGESLNLNTYQPDLCRYRGDILRIAGMLEDSVRQYDYCLQLDGRDHESYFGRSMTYVALGRLDLASADLKRCLELAPTSPDSVSGLPTFRFVARNVPFVEATYRDILSRGGASIETRIDLALVYVIDHNYDAAENELTTCIAQNPSHAPARIYRAFTRVLAGNLEGAIEDAKAHSLSTSALANAALAVAYEKLGRTEEAFQFYKAAITIDPKLSGSFAVAFSAEISLMLREMYLPFKASEASKMNK